MARRPTLTDVAAAAGVSRALVSIVIRGVPGASDATRERVLAVAAQLGYRPDTRARLLRSSRSRLLGVVFDVDGPFHTEIVEALYPAAAAFGFDITLSARGHRRSEDVATRSLLDLGVEALLVLGPASSSESLAAQPVPVVSVLEPHADPRFSSAATDEAAGIALAVQHLRGLGHMRIAHIDGGAAAGSDARKLAYEQLMAEEGMQPLVIPGGPSETDGMKAARILLSRRLEGSATELPTAVVVFNDDAALGLLYEHGASGASVPAGLSVVGYDDSRLAALAHVQLTSVRQDPDAIAAAAVEAAAAALEGRHTHKLVPPSLTVRSSTAPLPAVAQ